MLTEFEKGIDKLSEHLSMLSISATVIIKMTKVKDMTVLNAAREKSSHAREILIRLSADFSAQSLHARREL